MITINKEIIDLIDGDFNEYLEKSNILITNHSSACLETLAKGVPVIIYNQIQGLIYNPIPSSIKEGFWKMCFDSKHLTEAVIGFYNSRNDEIDVLKKIGSIIRKNYFEPVTAEGIRNLLRINQY